MLRFRDSKSPQDGYHYFTKSDSGLEAAGLRNEVGGKAAELLGLDKQPDFDQFKNLLHGLHPDTGEQLTAKLVEGRISYWDITASVPKGVTIAIEGGDERVHQALWEAGREAMRDIEAMTTTRERAGGVHNDRLAGNMIWYGFEHPETRPAKQDNMPDPDRHIHFVVPNVCYDAAEDKWKALKFRPIYEMRKYFDRRFDMALASRLTDLGYEIETKYRPDSKGMNRYYSWDINDIPKSVVEKFSRRTGEVDDAEKAVVERNKERDAADGLDPEKTPTKLSPMARDELGATSRQFKRQDLTLNDYRQYWQSKITNDERQKIAQTIIRAMKGQNPKPESRIREAVAYSLSHHFERQSVMPLADLAVTAMEKAMGAGHPDEVLPEAKRQGLLTKDGEGTTKDVLDQEGRIIRFAREGRGMMRPLGLTAIDGNKHHQAVTLSAEQQVVFNHMLQSPDRFQLIIGGAGTGKTHTLKAAISQMDVPVALMAPTTGARDVLQEDFKQARTVASFLEDTKVHAKMKNGVLIVDEFGLLPIKDLDHLRAIAEQQNARIIAIGDQKQHESVVRNGDMFHVLREYAGLPAATLSTIRRQTGDYAQAVTDIRDGSIADGVKKLDCLGWVKYVDDDQIIKATVNKWFANHEKGWDSVISGITHDQNDQINQAIRDRLREQGRLDKDEKTFEKLVAVGWTEAEKGDKGHYDGSEVIQYRRNSGNYRAGQTVEADHWLHAANTGRAEHYSVYHRQEIGVSRGDVIRITSNGWDKTRTHRLSNGKQYAVAGFSKSGEIVLDNGWTLAKNFGHIDHAWANTSFKIQGRTEPAVISVMSRSAYGAVNAPQAYVDLTRGKFEATVITDMSQLELIEAAGRVNQRKSATALMGSVIQKTVRERVREHTHQMIRRAQQYYQQLRERMFGDIEKQPEKGLTHGL